MLHRPPLLAVMASEYYIPTVLTNKNKESSITHTIKTIKPADENIVQYPVRGQPSSKAESVPQSKHLSSQQVKQSLCAPAQERKSAEKEVTVDDYDEISASEKKDPVRPATAKPDYLQWDIKEVKHEKRDPKFQYKGPGKLQAIEN